VTPEQKAAKQKLERIMDELKSEKLFLTCGKHSYVAWVKNHVVNPPKPISCPFCWKAYFFTVHAQTAPHLRQEHLEELEEVIRKTVEYEKTGKLDYELYSPGDSRFAINVERGAADDETGEDKIVIPGEERLN